MTLVLLLTLDVIFSSGSLEQSPRLADPYCDSETTSLVHSESQLKENLADAMMESSTGASRDTGN